MPREKDIKRHSTPPPIVTSPVELHVSPSAPELTIAYGNGDIPSQNGTVLPVTEEVAVCPDHEHLEIAVVDEVLDCDVDTLYRLLFSKHPFYKHFQEHKKSNNIVVSEWSEHEEDGEKVRNLSYVISLNHSMGPKTALSTEKQIMRAESPGLTYVVDAECYTRNVPYGEHFFLLNRFCLSRVTMATTRLVITSRIVYVKKCWGLVKKFIETNVKSGVRESYTLLIQLLREEFESPQIMNHNAPDDNKNITRKRRGSRRNLSRTSSTSTDTNNNTTESQKLSPAEPSHKSTARRCSKVVNSGFTRRENKVQEHDVTTDFMAKCVFILLVLLIAIHGTLFYKLRLVEEQASIMIQSGGNSPHSGSSFQSAQWNCEDKFREREGNYMNNDLDTWRDVLTSSAEIMASVQQNLLQLQTDINSRNRHKGTIP